MAITEEILERCRQCCLAAKQTLLTLSEGRFLDPTTVIIRRRAADISAEASFALLRRAFITPLDREDVWQLRYRAERLWRESENTALRVQGAKERCRSFDMVYKAADCCDVLHVAMERFPNPFDVASVYSVIEDLHCRLLRETDSVLTDNLFCVAAACDDLLFWLQYVLLKHG